MFTCRLSGACHQSLSNSSTAPALCDEHINQIRITTTLIRVIAEMDDRVADDVVFRLCDKPDKSRSVPKAIAKICCRIKVKLGRISECVQIGMKLRCEL